MRITRNQLRQIIQEELKRTLREDQGQAYIVVGGTDLSAMGMGNPVINVRLTEPGGDFTKSGSGKSFNKARDQAVKDAQEYIDELKRENPGAKLKKATDLDPASLDLIKDLK
jgi:ribosomal protein L29